MTPFTFYIRTGDLTTSGERARHALTITALTYTTDGVLWAVGTTILVSAPTPYVTVVARTTTLGTKWTHSLTITALNSMLWTIVVWTPITTEWSGLYGRLPFRGIVTTGMNVFTTTGLHFWSSADGGTTWSRRPWTTFLLITRTTSTHPTRPPATHPVTPTHEGSYIICGSKGILFLWAISDTSVVSWPSYDKGQSWTSSQFLNPTTGRLNYSWGYNNRQIITYSGTLFTGKRLVSTVQSTGPTAYPSMPLVSTNSGALWRLAPTKIVDLSLRYGLINIVRDSTVGFLSGVTTSTYPTRPPPIIYETSTGTTYKTTVRWAWGTQVALTPATRGRIHPIVNSPYLVGPISSKAAIAKIRQYPRDDIYVRSTARQRATRNGARSRQSSRRQGGRGTYV